MQWLTTHEPSTEHDLAVGLRENFDARARWKTAIAGVRVVGRLNSGLARKASSSASSGSSGGWAGISDDEDEERLPSPSLKSPAPGSNANVQVIPPEAEPLMVDEPESDVKEEKSAAKRKEDEEELNMPGSFDLSGPPTAEGETSWGDMLRKMHLKQ